MKFLTDMMKVGIGMERMFFFILITIILIHIQTCLWVMLPQFLNEETDPKYYYRNTWI